MYKRRHRAIFIGGTTKEKKKDCCVKKVGVFFFLLGSVGRVSCSLLSSIVIVLVMRPDYIDCKLFENFYNIFDPIFRSRLII